MEKKEFESRARGEGRGVIELSERIYNPVDGPAWQLLKVKPIQSSCRERQRQVHPHLPHVCDQCDPNPSTRICIHSRPDSQLPAHSFQEPPIESRPLIAITKPVVALTHLKPCHTAAAPSATLLFCSHRNVRTLANDPKKGTSAPPLALGTCSHLGHTRKS